MHCKKESKWGWSGNTTITHCRQTHVRKCHRELTITQLQEVNQSKATSSLVPNEMIRKLEMTPKNGIFSFKLANFTDTILRIDPSAYLYKSHRVLFWNEWENNIKFDIMGIYLSKALTCMNFFLYKQNAFLSRKRVTLATLLYEQFIHLT